VWDFDFLFWMVCSHHIGDRHEQVPVCEIAIGHTDHNAEGYRLRLASVRLDSDDQTAQAIGKRFCIPGEQVTVCWFQSVIDGSNHLAMFGLSWRSVVEGNANLTEAYLTAGDKTETFAFGFGVRGSDDHPGDI